MAVPDPVVVYPNEAELLIRLARTEVLPKYIKKRVEEECRDLPWYRRIECVQDVEMEVYREAYNPYVAAFNPFLPFDPEYEDHYTRLWLYGDKLVRLEDPVYGDEL